MAKLNENAVTVAKKMDETAFAVQSMVNKWNDEHQIQINDTYFPKGLPEDQHVSENLEYGRRGININVVDMPAVVAAIAELYEKETGKKLEI